MQLMRRFMQGIKDTSHHRTSFDVEKCGNKFVIGAGFGRTGTTSLHVALQQLGFNTYHSTTIPDNPNDAQLWMKAGQLKRSKLDQNNVKSFFEWKDPKNILNGTTQIQNEFNWDDIYQTKTSQKYNASVGGASIPFYLDLLHFYQQPPYNYDVKVILTQRENADIWWKSVEGSVGKAMLTMNSNWFLRLITKRFYRIIGSVLNLLTDSDDVTAVFTDGEKMKPRYLEWNKAVIENVPSDKLLIYDVKDGWEPLCKFLDMEIPNEPFPKSNESQQMQRMIKNFRILGFMMNGVVIIAGSSILYYFMRLYFVENPELESSSAQFH